MLGRILKLKNALRNHFVVTIALFFLLLTFTSCIKELLHPKPNIDGLLNGRENYIFVEVIDDERYHFHDTRDTWRFLTDGSCELNVAGYVCKGNWTKTSTTSCHIVFTEHDSISFSEGDFTVDSIWGGMDMSFWLSGFWFDTIEHEAYYEIGDM